MFMSISKFLQRNIRKSVNPRDTFIVFASVFLVSFAPYNSKTIVSNPCSMDVKKGENLKEKRRKRKDKGKVHVVKGMGEIINFGEQGAGVIWFLDRQKDPALGRALH
jgi:hypothetical protein